MGAGKSTIARAIAEQSGAPLFDADSVVHEFYLPDGPAYRPILERFPDAADSHGRIDRKRLSKCLDEDANGFAELEAIVHPMVAKKRKKFLEHHRGVGAWAVILDIPLLLEGSTRGKGGVDILLVVDADERTRRRRLQKRANMSREQFDLLENQQLSIEEKRQRADHVIENNDEWNESRGRLDFLVSEWAKQAGVKLPACPR